jgi:hypothetical protein
MSEKTYKDWMGISENIIVLPQDDDHSDSAETTSAPLGDPHEDAKEQSCADKKEVRTIYSV